ncbi:MAG: spore maturation protein [Bacteroidales bacterium]|nr:spore maturation protein [Bacteroidales bacterium]
MVLNYIWIAFFVLGFLAALYQLVFQGNAEIFPEMVTQIFSSAKTGFEISLGLTGILTLWSGLLKVGEKGGMTNAIAKLFGPFFRRLFPEIPKDHPAMGSIVMNFSANMLGLDNAATPLGLKAMNQMQELNPNKDTASNAQIMFLTLNASGLTILPITIMMYRIQMGAADPSDIFIPILLATSASTFCGLLAVCIWQKINLFDKVIMAYIGGFLLLEGLLVWQFSQMDQETISRISSVSANLIIFTIIVLFIVMAAVKKINVYDAFIEGAKDGFQTAVKIIPYLVAMLIAIGVFRASGALTLITDGLASGLGAIGVDTQFIPALPTALMKPLSGSGARGMMIDCMTSCGVDSFAGRLSCTMQGAADTTFYIVALYFGSAGIKNTRYAVSAGLIAEVAGIIASIAVAYMFFR